MVGQGRGMLVWMSRPRCYVAVSCGLLISLLMVASLQAQDGAVADPPATRSRISGKLAELGSYERGGLRYALSKHDLEVEESPEGKLLGKITVVNLNVLGKEVGALRWLNFFHVTTRRHVIEREVLLRPGELWNEERIAETERKLKDPLFTSLVVVVPVRSEEPARFDLLVVTRDIWSLRMNSTFEYLQGSLTGLQLSVAENNILGLRKHGAFVFDMDQGRYTLGPQYVDKALAGTRLQLTTRFSAIFSRAESEFEGTASGTRLAYPLWSLRQKWGGDLRISHANLISRAFQGNALELVDLEDTPEVEELPRIYSIRSLRLVTRVQRSFGTTIKQRLSFGHSLSVFRPGFIEGFVATGEQRLAFADQVFPRSERVSAVFARYGLFTPTFIVYRNLNGFDLAEDVRLGPDVSVGLSVALAPLGSETTFYRPDVSASYVLDLAEDGFVRASAGASSRLEKGEFIDNLVEADLKIASPRVANLFRVVAKAGLGIRLRERGNGRFRLGGNNGLRGYLISEFSGQKQLLTNLEVRSMPMRILFARVGALAFWDMGHTADRLADLRMKHSVGVGFRSLVPQLQPIVFRLDWAFPLQEASFGFPGRISAGVAQVF